MPRTARQGAFLRGRVARVTRTDGCGRFVIGEYNHAVSEGIVTAAFTANTTETTAIDVPNMAGKRCVYEPAQQSLAGYSVNLTFCNVDFEFFEIITKQPLVFDATGAVVGIEPDTKIALDDEGFALEMWMGSQGADACDDPNAQGEFGYSLLPLLKGGILGDFTIENNAINFVIQNASTRDGNQWGNGPYPVEIGTGTSEVQRVTITGVPTGGTFTLTYAGQTTGPIAYNATAATVQAALEALSNVGTGDIVVGGGPGPSAFWTLTFAGGLANQNVAQLTATGSLTGGTAPAVAVTTTTPGVAGAPRTLFQAVSRTAPMRLQVVTASPPEPMVGARPVLNPTLGALGTILTAGSAGLNAAFQITGGSTGPVWWDFGDGEWDYVVAPGTASHSYEVAGEYTVRASQNGVNWQSLVITVPFP